MPTRRDRDFGIMQTLGSGVRALRALLLGSTPIVLFFMLYTDFFTRALPVWASVIHLAALSLVIVLVIAVVAKPPLMDAWSAYWASMRMSVTRRRRIAFSTAEIGLLVLFLYAYSFFRNPDGTRPLSYDIAVTVYVAVVWLLLLTILGLPRARPSNPPAPGA